MGISWPNCTSGRSATEHCEKWSTMTVSSFLILWTADAADCIPIVVKDDGEKLHGGVSDGCDGSKAGLCLVNVWARQ